MHAWIFEGQEGRARPAAPDRRSGSGHREDGRRGPLLHRRLDPGQRRAGGAGKRRAAAALRPHRALCDRGDPKRRRPRQGARAPRRRRAPGAELTLNFADVAVVVAGVASIGALAWYFFGPKKARQAELVGAVQEVKVTVKGGYSPDVIRVRQNVPLRIVFDRQESGECTSRVVFPDFALNRALPAYATTGLEFTPDRSGRFGFACGMNMVHGTLVVEPNGSSHGNGHAESVSIPTPQAPRAEETEIESPDAEAAERKAEITDLTRRVAVAAIFTAPVLYAALVSLVQPAWVPPVLLNRWIQLILITPVFFYSGWPIHRIGWLSIAHRAAEMNALIPGG